MNQEADRTVLHLLNMYVVFPIAFLHEFASTFLNCLIEYCTMFRSQSITIKYLYTIFSDLLTAICIARGDLERVLSATYSTALRTLLLTALHITVFSICSKHRKPSYIFCFWPHNHMFISNPSICIISRLLVYIYLYKAPE